MGQNEMKNGSVKWFDQIKGYGFIEQTDGGKDIFVHISALNRSGIKTLKEGQKVRFEVSISNRDGKTSAENIVILQDYATE